MVERRILNRIPEGMTDNKVNQVSRLIMAGTLAAFTVISSSQNSHAEETRSPVKSLHEFRTEHVVTQSMDKTCSAAVLATILNFKYNVPVTEKGIAIDIMMNRGEYVVSPEKTKIHEGFSLADLQDYLERHGFEGTGYGKQNYERLLKKTPVIVPVNFKGDPHFVVFRGVTNSERGVIALLADPAWGNRTMPWEEFEKGWTDFGGDIGRVSFVVKRKDGEEPNESPLDPKIEEFPMLR